MTPRMELCRGHKNTHNLLYYIKKNGLPKFEIFYNSGLLGICASKAPLKGDDNVYI